MKKILFSFLSQFPSPQTDRCNLSLQSIRPKSESLSSIVRGFKIGVIQFANKNNILFKRQSRFNDHIIRDQQSYDRISYYIQSNPSTRDEDCHKS